MRDELFKVYVCDSLHRIPQGQYLTMRYIDCLTPKKPQKKKTGAEIVIDVMTRGGLKFKEDKK